MTHRHSAEANSLNRRRFLDRSRQVGAALAAGRLAVSPVSADGAPVSKPAPKIAVFTKSFQDRAIPTLCQTFAKMGIDGLDLTVRPGGHIEPKDVAVELPLADKSARKAGLAIVQLTTSITADDRHARQILATAADLGIRRIKLGYFRYREFGTLAKQMAAVRGSIGRIVRLASRYRVLPCVHIHSGPFIPSHGTMLYELIRDFAPSEVGAYVDPLHMTLEGGRDGWRQGLDLLAPWIALCSVKNFAWEQTGRDRKGQMRWRTRTVPPADGVCPLPDFVTVLKKIGYMGPYSLHSEYKSSHSFKRLDTDGCIRQTRIDLDYFRSLL